MQQKLITQKAILHPTIAEKHYTLQQYSPSIDLAPYIQHFWIVRWLLPAGIQFPAEVLPNPNINMSFTADAARITGVVTKKFVHTLHGEGCVLGVNFKPGGFHPFFKRPISDLTDTSIPVAEIFGNDSLALNAHLLTTALDTKLISHVEALLRNKHPEPDDHIAVVDEIITKIRDDHSITRVKAAAQSFGMSERTLQHLFHTYVGVGPKWVIDRYRLQDAAAAINKGRSDWMTIAHEAGYADQSHFIRDFKNIIGETPNEYKQRSSLSLN